MKTIDFMRYLTKVSETNSIGLKIDFYFKFVYYKILNSISRIYIWVKTMALKLSELE